MARRYSKHKNRKTRNKRKKSIKNKRGGGTIKFGLTYDENSPNKYENLLITKCINDLKTVCPEGGFSKTFTVKERKKKENWTVPILGSEYYTEKKMAMKISHTYLDVTNLYIVKRGNENHGKLQQLINKEDEDELKKKNYHIVKLYAFGTITEYNNNNKLSKDSELLKNNNKLSIDRALGQINKFGADSQFSIAEKVKGGELFNYIVGAESISVDIATEILLQVAYALKFIHDNDYIYYDLKPENIVLLKNINSREDVDIRLIDFDFMIDKEEAAKDTPICGSPFYAAPEVFGYYYSKEKNRFIEFKRPHTSKLDIISFGLVIIALVHRTLAFIETKPDDENIKVFYDGEVNFTTKTENSYLIYLAKQCLKLEPEKRPNINEVIDYLKKNKV